VAGKIGGKEWRAIEKSRGEDKRREQERGGEREKRRVRRKTRLFGMEEAVGCQGFAQGAPVLLDGGGDRGFKSFQCVVVGDIWKDERSEGANVVVVGLGVRVDANCFETRCEGMFDFGERARGRGGRRGEGSTDDDLDVAAEGGRRVVGDAEGNDSDGKIMVPSIRGNARGAAFKGEMTRAEGARAFWEYSEDTAAGEELVAKMHSVDRSIDAVFFIVFIFIADDADAGKEKPS
jgi:hypothetical protein